MGFEVGTELTLVELKVSCTVRSQWEVGGKDEKKNFLENGGVR